MWPQGVATVSSQLVTCVCVCVLQVVFRGGEGALQVLPPLIDVIPEARLNLVIYYLRQGGALPPPILNTVACEW